MGLTFEQRAYMRLHQDEYPEGFFHWLQENQHVWRAFEEKAYLMAAVVGRPRYSARTIVEVMRWDSDVADKEVTFKINDHAIPGMARLWMAKHGKNFPKFFELRGSKWQKPKTKQ